MHVYQYIERDEVGIERYDDRFGIAVMRSKGLDETLLHLADTTKRLKHRFGAPVTAASKPDADIGQWTSLTRISWPLNVHVSPTGLPSSAV